MSSVPLPPCPALNVGMRSGVIAIIFDSNENRKITEMQTLITIEPLNRCQQKQDTDFCNVRKINLSLFRPSNRSFLLLETEHILTRTMENSVGPGQPKNKIK